MQRLLLFLFLLLSPNPIQFTVTDGPDTKEIRKAISEIPLGFLTHGTPHTWMIVNPPDDAHWKAESALYGFHYDDPRHDSSFIIGETLPEVSVVLIRHWGSDFNKTQTTLHEIGHCIWDDRMSARQQLAYTSLWQEESKKHHLVTDYAYTNSAEGFAESFSYWISQPAWFKKNYSATAAYFETLLTELSSC